MVFFGARDVRNTDRQATQRALCHTRLTPTADFLSFQNYFTYFPGSYPYEGDESARKRTRGHTAKHN